LIEQAASNFVKQSQRLRLLAEGVRSGVKINWKAESDALALEQAGQDAEYAEAINERWRQRFLEDSSGG